MRRIGILTSGGDCQALNATMRGVAKSLYNMLDSVEDVIEYFDEAGMDVDGAVDDEILEADEVFDIGDGRYLIVEA